MSEIRIPYQELVDQLTSILLKYDFCPERASLCATLFSKANLDGVPSHGLNRFPIFLEMINQKLVDAQAEPELAGSFGSFERWDGNLGPGNINAHQSMDRAIHLAKTKGIGCVTIKNTNHWMRGGNFGWQAIEKGCLGICFTNTKPNMPAWGGKEPKLGNNPIILAIPHKHNPLVLDMALSQFSYGKISTYLNKQEAMPYDAGFDLSGNLTKNPETILSNEMALPIGLWKGAGLSLMLDMFVSVLSDGNSTFDIGKQKTETAVSQFFMCFYLPKIGITTYPDDKIDLILQDLKSSASFGKKSVRFPGENTLSLRMNNQKYGVPVDPDIWESILKNY
ncbi:MAG: 3-dehydro-L-gulonate 2-dehydrogenase [Balneolales bacterium]